MTALLRSKQNCKLSNYKLNHLTIVKRIFVDSAIKVLYDDLRNSYFFRKRDPLYKNDIFHTKKKTCALSNSKNSILLFSSWGTAIINLKKVF